MQDYGFFLDLFGNATALGFILYLHWRTTNHTIPRLAKSFEDATKTARQDFRDEMRQTRVDFRDELKQQRVDFIVRLGTK